MPPPEGATGRGRYWDYLKIPELLGAQQPVTEHPDEDTDNLAVPPDGRPTMIDGRPVE